MASVRERTGATPERTTFRNVVGGEISPTMFIPVSNTELGQAESSSVESTLQSNWIGGASMHLFAHGAQYTVNPDNLIGSGMGMLVVTIGTAEPKIPNTNIPVYRISALLDGGMRISEVMEDFPSLNADQVLWAQNYARHYPNPGKAYPQKSLKRLLRNSGFAELDRALRRRKK